MKFPDKSYNLRIELDTKNCELTPDQLARIERGLHPLREPVRDFPVSDLYITIAFHPRSTDYHVRTALVLPGRTLMTGERGHQALGAFEQCVRKLVRRVAGYKENLAAKPEQSKQRAGTHQDVLPEDTPDAEQLQQAIDELDYVAFRRATLVYEESIRKRVGRWINRYPEVEAQLGNGFAIADLVEEVFLNAFEEYGQRPANLTLSQWLEDLIDPSIKAVLENPEEELQNIQAVRMLQDTQER
jgi:ribosome-associated translation inhibitor RaiA